MLRTVEAIAHAKATGKQVELTIDGKPISVPLGTTLLEAATALRIRIPTLCYHEDLCLAGVCRICVVEIQGQRTLQAACSYPITTPINVLTHTPKVRRARRHILDLMLAGHYGNCCTCVRNNHCELQALAAEYGVDFYRLGHLEAPRYEIDASSYAVRRDINKCILCRRCIRTCIDLQEVGVLEAIGRGNRTRVSTFMEKPLADVICINCGQCSNRCPTGALQANDVTDDVWAAIDDPELHVIIQTAPSPRAAIGECFGLAPGHALTFELNTALRGCGFDKVFDTNFTADLTMIEEGTELLLRLRNALAGDEVGSRQSAVGSEAGPAVSQSTMPPESTAADCHCHCPLRLAAIHQLLARLGQVHRALLSRVHTESLDRQEPAANVRHAAEDVLRQTERARPGEDRHRGADALLGEEVRVQPAGDVPERLQGHRLRSDYPRAGRR